jgi:hypothetical protein
VNIRPRGQVDDLGHKREEPRHIKEAKDGVGHRLDGAHIGGFQENLPGEDHEQEKHQDAHLEIVRVFGEIGRQIRLPRAGEIIEAAQENERPADHADDLEIRHLRLVQHRVEFPQSEEPQPAHQDQKPGFVPGEDDPKRHGPEEDRAEKPI